MKIQQSKNIILNESKPIESRKNLLDQKLMEVASLYEKEFMRELVKAMRSTVSESSLLPKNQVEKMFTDELFAAYAESMAEHGSGQLRKFIYDNLIQKWGTSLGRHSKKDWGPVFMIQLLFQMSQGILIIEDEVLIWKSHTIKLAKD